MAAFERATVGLILWWGAQNALAVDTGGALVSRAGVGETADRLELDARARGVKVLDRTDHADSAGRHGFRIAPLETLVFDDGAGAPMRVVVWQSTAGDTLVSADDRPGLAGREPASERGEAASVRAI